MGDFETLTYPPTKNYNSERNNRIGTRPPILVILCYRAFIFNVMEKFKIEIANEIYEDYKQGLSEWNDALNIVETVLDSANFKDLQHYKDSTSGLYATDRPELFKDECGVMFKLDGDVDEKNLINRVDLWCASSLDPETSQKWEYVKDVLFKTRKLLRSDS